MSEASKIIHLTIIKWDKWNPRKDLKSTSWLRLQNTVFEDPQFYDFSHSEFLFFVYLLCLASKKQSGRIDIHVAHAERVGRFQVIVIFSAIEKLKDLHIIRERDAKETEPHADVTLRTNEHNETERTNNLVEAKPRRMKFDFEDIYKNYPRKLGKAGGMLTLSKTILTEQDYADLAVAVKNYASDCAKKGTEEKYIKHFSTFIGTAEKQSWRDWVSYSFNGTGKPKSDYSFLLEGDVP